jgi:transcription antitermination factor NusG
MHVHCLEASSRGGYAVAVTHPCSDVTLAPGSVRAPSKDDGGAWFAVYTASRHEKSVQSQLIAKRIQSFLPLYKTVRRWNNGVRREVEHPLFPGYIFVRFGADDQLRVMQTAGVAYIVGNGTSPLPLDDCEMQALRVGSQCASIMPHPFLCEGDKVCIRSGPFQGVTGYVQQYNGNLALVVTVQLIQKSFAIRVKTSELELAG